jgi:hypothetical protein
MAQDQRKTANLAPQQEESIEETPESQEFQLSQRLLLIEQEAAKDHERLEDFRRNSTQ